MAPRLAAFSVEFLEKCHCRHRPCHFWHHLLHCRDYKGVLEVIFRFASHLRDFWRALKERHPFTFSIARGPNNPSNSTAATSRLKKLSFSLGFPLGKLPPILPSRIRLSFLHSESSTPLGTGVATTPTLPCPYVEFPELAVRRTDLENPYHTFPRSQWTPRIYLHTPQWEIDGTPPPRDFRRHSLPSMSPSPVNSANHIPVGVGSSAISSARVSLLSVATDSLALESKLESCVDE